MTVRGLAIDSFSQGAGILITGTGASGNVIAANDIGTDPSGSLALPNDFGIRILAGAHDNLVGGSTAAAGNLITNNLGPGVSVEGNPSVGNRITANQIFANDVAPTPTPAGMLQFDGSSYVRLPGALLDLYNAISRTVTQTIEAWFQTTSGGVILGAETSSPSTNPTHGVPLVYVGGDGRLYAGIPGVSPISSDATVNDGRWHHVALVLSNTFQALFLDGQNVGSTSSFFLGSGGPYNQIGTGYTDSSEPFTPGGWYGFRGQIDDVRIWSVEANGRRDSPGHDDDADRHRTGPECVLFLR